MDAVMAGAFHVYVVPAGKILGLDPEGVMVNGVLLHTAVVIVLITGVDFKITLTVNVAPVQFPKEEGVTMYVTV
jgi:hypothetical protein